MNTRNDSVAEFFRGSVYIMLGAALAVASAVVAAPALAQDKNANTYNKSSGKTNTAPAEWDEAPMQPGKPASSKPLAPQTAPSGKSQGSTTIKPASGWGNQSGSSGASQTKQWSTPSSPGGKGQSSVPGNTKQPSAWTDGKSGNSNTTIKPSRQDDAWQSSGKGGSESKSPSGRNTNAFDDRKYPPKDNGSDGWQMADDPKYPDRHRGASNQNPNVQQEYELDEWGKRRQRGTGTTNQNREMQETVELDEWGKPRQRGSRTNESYQDERDDDAQPRTRDQENRPPRRGYVFQCPGADRSAVTRLQCVNHIQRDPALIISFDTDVGLEAAVNCLWGGRITPQNLGYRFVRVGGPGGTGNEYVFYAHGHVRPLPIPAVPDVREMQARRATEDALALANLLQLTQLAVPGFSTAINRCTNAPDQRR